MPAAAGSLGVAADGVDRPSETVISEEQANDEVQDPGEPDRSGYAEPVRRSEVGERRREVVEGLAVRQADRETAEQDQHRQGHHERVELRLGHQPTVDDAHNHPDGDHHAHRHVLVEIEALAPDRGFGDEPRSEHRGETDDRLERKVELANDQDQSFGQDDHRQLRRLLEHVDEVGLGQEGVVHERADDQRGDQDGDERKLLDELNSRMDSPGGSGGRRRGRELSHERSSDQHPPSLPPACCRPEVARIPG